MYIAFGWPLSHIVSESFGQLRDYGTTRQLDFCLLGALAGLHTDTTDIMAEMEDFGKAS